MKSESHRIPPHKDLISWKIQVLEREPLARDPRNVLSRRGRENETLIPAARTGGAPQVAPRTPVAAPAGSQQCDIPHGSQFLFLPPDRLAVGLATSGTEWQSQFPSHGKSPSRTLTFSGNLHPKIAQSDPEYKHFCAFRRGCCRMNIRVSRRKS